MAAVPPFEFSVLERICDVLAATDDGLTGGEITKLLSQLAISDPIDPGHPCVRINGIGARPLPRSWMKWMPRLSDKYR
jgi:hypothetical protein